MIPVGVFAIGCVVLLSGGEQALWGFPLDDAWIHRVYARAFAGFEGFAYNPGQQETGSTSPLWAILSAPAHWLQPLGDGAVVLAVKLLGMALAAVALLAVVRIGRLLGGSLSVGVLAACIVAADPRLGFAALSGMEIPLAVALWLWGTAALVEGRPRLGALLSGLAVTARPELVVPVGLLLAAGLGVDTVRRRLPPSSALSAAALAAAPPLAWAGLCLAVTGHPLPATFYRKQTAFSLGLDQLQQFGALLSMPGWLTGPLLVLGLILAVVLLLRRRDRDALLVGLSLGAGPLLMHLLVVGGRDVRLDGYYWTRWADPQAIALLALCAIAIVAALHRVEQLRRVGSSRVGRISLLVVLVFAALDVPEAWLERRSRLASDGAAIERMNVQPGRWIAEHTPRDAVVAVNDAGALRYFGERATIDLLGLNNHRITFGLMGPDDILAETTWVAVFPEAWAQTRLLDGFVERARFTMPPEDYTVCDCPGQALVVVCEAAGSTGTGG